MDTPQDTQPRAPEAPEFLQGDRMGFAVVAADMAERMGLVDYVNAHVAWDPKQCKVSPGLRLLALIVGCRSTQWPGTGSKNFTPIWIAPSCLARSANPTIFMMTRSAARY